MRRGVEGGVCGAEYTRYHSPRSPPTPYYHRTAGFYVLLIKVHSSALSLGLIYNSFELLLILILFSLFFANRDILDLHLLTSGPVL